MKTKILLVLLIIALAFSGCISEKIPEDAIYDRNLTEHWINGEDGEKLNLGEHELGEYKPGDMVTCSVCQSEIAFAFDGGAEINNFNEKGNQIRCTGYSKDGSVAYDYVTEYRYGENDEIIYCATYQNGRLYETYENIDGTIQEEYFEESGYHTLSITYKGYLGDTIINQWYAYDPEDNVRYESYTETFIDENGEKHRVKETETNYLDGIKTIGEYDSCMNPLSIKEYDFDGNLLSAIEGYYEYNEEGVLLYKKILLNGKLESEIFFDAETFYETKNIYYSNDGSYTVTEYNENGDIISETRYDLDGNIIE